MPRCATDTSCINKMKRLPRPCLDCGVLTTNTSRCDSHQQARELQQALRQDPKRKEKKARLYNSHYQGVAKAIRAIATNCYLCLEPFTLHNRVQVDHLYPSRFELSPLLPACERCNRRKGNRELNELDSVEFPGVEKALALYPPRGTS